MAAEDDFPEDLLVFKKQISRSRNATCGSESDADALSLHSMASCRSGLRLSRFASLASLLPGGGRQRRSAAAPAVCESPQEADDVGETTEAPASSVAPASRRGCSQSWHETEDYRRHSASLSSCEVSLQSCAHELVEAQRMFLRRLEACARVFVEPLLQCPSLPERLVRQLFSTLPQLRHPQRCLLKALESRRIDGLYRGVGEVLLDWSGDSEAGVRQLADYCSRLPIAREAHDQLRGRAAYRDFVRRALAVRRSLDGLDLWSHVQEPKAHLTRLPLLLERLAGLLAAAGQLDEEERVRQVTARVRRQLAFIDETISAEQLRRRAERLVSCAPPGLDRWQWLLMRQATVLAETTALLMPKRREVSLAVTPDLLLVQKGRGCRPPLLLCGLRVTPVARSRGCVQLCGQQLVCGAKRQATELATLTLLLADSPQPRSDWLSALRSAHTCSAICQQALGSSACGVVLRQGSQRSAESGYCTDH